MIYLANGNAFEETADAIREKLGTDLPLIWDTDTGFKDDIEQIPTGGGGTPKVFVAIHDPLCEAIRTSVTAYIV